MDAAAGMSRHLEGRRLEVGWLRGRLQVLPRRLRLLPEGLLRSACVLPWQRHVVLLLRLNLLRLKLWMLLLLLQMLWHLRCAWQASEVLHLLAAGGLQVL